MNRIIFLFALTTFASPVSGVDTFRVVTGARFATAGADGGIYLLTAKRAPTPGAWIQRCEDYEDSLTRLDGRAGAVSWSTCLPVRAENFVVDARGAVTVAGGLYGRAPVRATSGAYGPALSSAYGIAVIRLDPGGSAPEWIAILAGTDIDEPWARTAISPSGSVYGVATTRHQRLPLTGDALAVHRGSYAAYFFRLSGDGSKLLYATYLDDGAGAVASALTADPEGNVFAGGTCSSFYVNSREFIPSFATLGTFTTTRTPSSQAAWVARFEEARSGFGYAAVFGMTGYGIALTPAGNGRVAIAGTIQPGLLAPAPAALVTTNSGSYESFLLVLDSRGAAAEASATFGSGPVQALERSPGGGFLVIGTEPLMASSVDAWRPIGGAPGDFGFISALSAGGDRLVYSTGIECPSCTIRGTALAAGVLWIAATSPQPGLRIAPEHPVTVSRAANSVIQVMPDHQRWSRESTSTPILSWHTRDPAVRSASIRRGDPQGPVVARGTSGAIHLFGGDPSDYFFVAEDGKVLGYDTYTQHIPAAGFAYLWLDPNPVLSCRDQPLTGARTRVRGSSSGWTEVRVGSPDGPILTAGESWVDQWTGDWVRNGMSFHLNSTHAGLLGSARAYVLPNRSCASGAPPEPMIRATRDCVRPNHFTLAWWTGTAPVEIRRGSADGPKIARYVDVSGLFDVTADTPTPYVLMAWTDGDWKQVASVIADPRAPCEQGGR